MAPVGGTTAVRVVPPWVFWGAFAVCLAAIVGFWVLTLPIQWAAAEVPPGDPPRWTLLDEGDPAGRLKAQVEGVKADFDQTKDALIDLPAKIEQAQRFRTAGQTITEVLEGPPITPPLTPTP